MILSRTLLPLAAVAAALTAAPAAHAAMNVSSGADGLRAVAVSNGEHHPELSLVDDGGTPRYRFTDPGAFGGLQVGAGCRIDEQRGQDVTAVVCERLAPRAEIALGFQTATFSVAPDFPDPLSIFGGLGRAHIVGGAGDDVIEGSRGETVVDGRGGNDTIVDVSDRGGVRNVLRGGDGDDTIAGRTETQTGQQNQNRMFGDAGDDVLIAGDGFDTLDGGPGRDRLIGGGIVQARDGEADEITCFPGIPGRRVKPVTRAVVDLVDPVDLPGCDIVERAPRDVARQLAIGKVTTAGRTLRARLTCHGDVPCRGTLRALGRTARFSLAVGATKTVRVRLGRRARGTVAVTAAYPGPSGPRTTIRQARL
ncbi:MAG TPA: calcium-binding protein [Capillimicrobium sp.]|nr:calcium-binding protein [Capillimicrobium sp.]